MYQNSPRTAEEAGNKLLAESYDEIRMFAFKIFNSAD